jgi:hypothetical protein
MFKVQGTTSSCSLLRVFLSLFSFTCSLQISISNLLKLLTSCFKFNIKTQQTLWFIAYS